jgi:hypothetical protein
MLKYLRIAVSALSLIACTLLIALWVRSGWRDDVVIAPVIGSDERLILHSVRSFLVIDVLSWPPYIPLPPDITKFEHQTQPAAKRVGVPTLWLPCLLTYPYQLWLPLWIPAVAFAAAGALTWLVTESWWPRRFSLRTLLIATTLAAVLLGIMAVSNHVGN